MKSAMDDIRALIQEAKLRTVWWILCIFAVTYLLTHTSKSMLMNVPIAVLLVSGLRILLNEVEFKWKVPNIRPMSYLAHLEKKQLSLNDARVSTNVSPLQEWKKKIDSPVVEAAIEEFLDKALNDFVMDLWYSVITPDKEAPELIRSIAMDAIGEVSLRIKELNLVDLLLSDIVDLIGDHLDLFRKNQSAIGRDVMGTLSSEERDERLKHHLIASKELHPALISPECEYKVLQQLIGGLLAVVLRPREAKCPLVRCIARELLTCLVVQPIINFASPGYINELIECIILLYDSGGLTAFTTGQSRNVETHNSEPTVPAEHGSINKRAEVPLSQVNVNRKLESSDSGNPLSNTIQDESSHHADWAKGFEAATQRRTEVLMPENLENMWAIGTNYKKNHLPKKDLLTESPKVETETSNETEVSSTIHEQENTKDGVSQGNKKTLIRSHSNIDTEVKSSLENMFNRKGSALTKSHSGNFKEPILHKSSSDTVSRDGVLHVPKLRCRVIGASFEKLVSNSFAVYAICVTDAGHASWFVKRRYRNFERLHRHLKDIPNFTLHLPPKRIFSSSTEDAFVHQRCIQLDKYLQDLLSIANVAEQHEVWDFLSASSKNYSFGTSSSVMTTLAVRVDDAMDEIARQFKGVSDGLMRKVGGSSYEPSSPVTNTSVSWNADDINKLAMRQSTSNSLNSFSDNEEGDKDVNGWHLDNEMKEDPTGVPPEWTPPNLSVPVLNLVDKVFQLERRGWLRRQVFYISKQILQLAMEDAIDDCLLRQIQWLRREDVIAQGIRWVQDIPTTYHQHSKDSCSLLIQLILWPNGTFFLALRIQGKSDSGNEANQGQQNSRQRGRRFTKMGSFEQQLEASRRASDVKNMIFNGAPAPLVSFIGYKQYMRCARDIYYFLQSTVCLKQLGYGILELVLLSLFPELRDVVRDIHEKMHVQPS